MPKRLAYFCLLALLTAQQKTAGALELRTDIITATGRGMTIES
jgi:hypothetical protein